MTEPALRPAPLDLADRVSERGIGTWRVLTASAPVESVVSFQGSFATYPDLSSGEAILQDLVVTLLDKGTKHRDRFEIADVFDSTGAHLNISSNSLRVRFSGKAMPEHLAPVLDVLGEQLREPLFDPGEFEKARVHVSAAIQRDMESTASQASSALSRLLYRPSHPNHSLSPADALARLQSITLDEIRDFHERVFRDREPILVFVGDIDTLNLDQMVGDLVGDLPAGTMDTPPEYDGVLSVPGTDQILMPDKSNADVRFGHPIDVRRQDPDYLPLYVANFVLGGNFSARLMTEIRDRQGLTYGIYSNLSGITTAHSGHWIIGVTLSADNLKRGIEATRRELARFVANGITADELDEKKTTITGSFKVGMATTGGQASSLLYNAERGFDVGYLDRFPGEVNALEVDTVNDAIRAHLNESQLSVAIAGPAVR